MVNWEELKHIHVIRKLQQMLTQWFGADIFFLDDQGRVRNFDPAGRDQKFSNPLAAQLLARDKGREILFKAFADLRQQRVASDRPVPGPLGSEKMLVSPIVVDQLELGHVVAFAFLDHELSAQERQEFEGKAKATGLDPSALNLKVLPEKDRRYFAELVDLVAQEVVVFHTEISKREERINALNSQLGERYRYDAMIGKSKPMQELYSLLDKVKTSEATVLVQGENGTGKELIARSIHFNSQRKDAPFVTVNCSAFNENLLDSELFGHVKGSITGAVRDKKGLFEAANHGTLFLDEIGDMSPTMQVKLLRVLQEGTLMPVGGTDQRKVDVRVIAATNRDLKSMIEQGQFREDLYYRINVINLTVPPLRDRREDIPVLLDSFLVRGCKEKGVPLKSLAKRALEKILDYPWPGNVRELENEVERLIVLSGDEEKISGDLLSQRIRDFGAGAKVQGVRVTGKLKDALEELEKTMIREGLRRTKFNKSRLAKELGISRAGLIMKVEKYSLDQRALKKERVA